MPELQRPTVTIHYEDTGAGPANAPTLVFLHGWCDGAASWARTVQYFKATHRCIAPDMRGHGGSGMPTDLGYSHEALGNDVIALCQSLGVDHPVLIGHSFGGYLAAEISRRFPGFARGIVVEDQALDLRGFGSQMREMEAAIRTPGTHMAFRNALFESMITPLMSAEARSLVTRLKDTTPVVVGQALWAPLFEFTPEELGERSDALMAALANQPSMSIEHAESPEYHAQLYQHAPNAATRVIECGHWIHLERPVEFRAEVHDFLSMV